MGNTPITKSNDEVTNHQGNNSNSNSSQSQMQNSHTNTFEGFCGTKATRDIVKHKEVNEIILSKTYSYPKGTFNSESIKLFNIKERQLFHFASGDNVAAVRYLTINGVNINILDEDRTSPLHIACRTGSLQMVEELINQGSMINLPDLVGWTPLHIACFQSRPDVVLLLLKNGANYKFKNRDKLTPFELCANDKECLEIYNNFTIHERIELMRIIQLQKMKLEYFENYIKTCRYDQGNSNGYDNGNGNRNGISINKDIGNKEEYIQTLSYIKNDCDDLEPINTEVLNDGDINDNEQDKASEKLSHRNNEDKNKNKDDDDCIDEVPNEFVNYIDEESNKNNKRNLDFTQKYLSKYKYIPKKHRFYLQYQMTNGKVLQRSVTNSTDLRSSKVNPHSLLIRLPNQFPVMTSIQQLNREYNRKEANEELLSITDTNLLTEEHEKYKAYDNTSDCEESDVQFNHSVIAGNKGELYNTIRTNGKNVIGNANGYGNSTNTNTINKQNSNDDDSLQDEDTIIEDVTMLPLEIIHMSNIKSRMNNKVINDITTNAFIQDNTKLFNDLFLYQLKLPNEVIEDLLIDLFTFDYNFALMLLLTLYKNNNTYGSLIHIIKHTITSKQLKSIILIGCFDHYPTLIEAYLSSLPLPQLDIKDILQSAMQSIINPNDIFSIDRLSKAFAKVYYPLIQNSDEPLIATSQNALYFLIFSLLITEMAINTPSSLEQKEKYICDLMIILKDMNEGESFNQEYLNSLIKYIKSNGFFCKGEGKALIDLNSNTFQLGVLLSNDSYTTYNAYYHGKGIFILFENNKKKPINTTNAIDRLILLNFPYVHIEGNDNMIVVSDRFCKGNRNRRGGNVYILHNKSKSIKIKQYYSIKLYIDNKARLNDIMQ